jgi:hypothetical protein
MAGGERATSFARGSSFRSSQFSQRPRARLSCDVKRGCDEFSWHAVRACVLRLPAAEPIPTQDHALGKREKRREAL